MLRFNTAVAATLNSSVLKDSVPSSLAVSISSHISALSSRSVCCAVSNSVLLFCHFSSSSLSIIYAPHSCLCCLVFVDALVSDHVGTMTTLDRRHPHKYNTASPFHS